METPPPPVVADDITFRLPNDPRLRVAAPASAFERLRTAYAHDLGREPRLHDWTLTAIEDRLRADLALAHPQQRVHHNRARLLQVFLLKAVEWPTSRLQVATGLTYTQLYDTRQALITAGLLRLRRNGPHENTTELTPAGQAWLVALVEPGTVG